MSLLRLAWYDDGGGYLRAASQIARRGLRRELPRPGSGARSVSRAHGWKPALIIASSIGAKYRSLCGDGT